LLVKLEEDTGGVCALAPFDPGERLVGEAAPRVDPIDLHPLKRTLVERTRDPLVAHGSVAA
jgi:hypothetical protein